MRIVIIQPLLAWENRDSNLARLENMISRFNNACDIIILPEMFTTGFTMNTALAEPPGGVTFRWMKLLSENGNFGICGSYPVRDGNGCFNRFIFVNPEGTFFQYDKRHLFSIGEEDRYYSKGENRVIFEFRGFRISPYICYDLRFPVWSRNRDEYDLAIYVSSWPAARINVWSTLLIARAIENQCYVAGSNRTGTDGNGIPHNGMSRIVNPKGEILSTAGEGEETIYANLSINDLKEFRNKFNVLRDADDFRIL